MRYIKLSCIILILALACIPASGFKPNCDCADMDGDWVTSRQLYENDQVSNEITHDDMTIHMNGCGAEGTFGQGGNIFQASFAGGVANNLVGKWASSGEEGTFNIQLQNNEKDCASFEGWMYSGDKKWRWTGQKDKGATESPEIEVTTSQMGTLRFKQDDKIFFTIQKGDNAVLYAFCKQTLYKYALIKLVYDDVNYRDMPVNVQFAILNFAKILKLCMDETEKQFASLDVAQYGSSGDSLIQMNLELQQGSIRAEVLNDDEALDIQTPNVIVSSQGKNTFGVAYDPQSGVSIVAAHQYPIQVQPTDGSRAPFTLESGQMVEVGNGQVTPSSSSGQTPKEEIGGNQNPGFVPEGSEGGCYADPSTGEIVCVDSSGKPSESKGGVSEGCYQDPYTGQYICVDSYGESNDYQDETQVGDVQSEGLQGEGSQGLCFEDPDTGEIVCTDSGG